MSTSTHLCPKCGAVLPSNAAEGLCPRCLYAQLENPLAPEGAESEAEDSRAGPASTEGGSEREFGDYELFEEIGEGGMGVVYRARQVSLNRPVAVKVIKPGMDTRKIIARFDAERQALALMDHPGIARVFDAGATQAGRPYFVMELVRGVKITDYCEQHHLSMNERLGLFIQVCQAVQHAHQKGIIHRDLKPSNILVTELDGRPLPKIIDFGIAKATEGRLAGETLSTVAGQFIGTPAYLSPEQAEWGGVDIDTRSDIYSLGVLLYELLTGCLPFEPKTLAKGSLDEMRRTIREVTPVRPSTRLKRTQSAEAGVQPVQSQIANRKSQIHPDLDWIVMKCLEKDRARRYETANGLAQDLQRHLHNEPVLARPPSRLYEFQKTVRRHKIGFAATATVILVLIAGVLVSTWQAARANRAERKAQEEELATRQRAYASDMSLASQALDQNNLGGALALLNRQRPKPGETDLRGWEWRYLWQQTRSDALFKLCEINGEVESLVASPDGHWLAVGAFHQGGVAVWDLQTRQKVARLAANEEAVRAAFSPTEPLLAFSGIKQLDSKPLQSTLHLWNATTRQMLANIPLDGECDGLAFSKDGKTLVASLENFNTAGGHIILWRVSDGTKLASYPSEAHPITPATGFAAAPDLSLAAYVYGFPHPQKICIIDLRNGKELWTAVASPDFVTALAFSPDGKILASADGLQESDIYLWDAATGKKIGQLEGHNSWVGSLVFWADGKKLASASADQTIRIWDVAGRKCLDVMRGNRDEVWRLLLLPDDTTLVSGGKDGTICFWNTSVTHRRQESITWPEKIHAWVFAPDSHSVLTLDVNGEVARWTGANFQEKEPLLEVGTNRIPEWNFHYCFSQDGRFLAIGSTNGMVSIWDLSRRVRWRDLTNTTGDTLPINFAADGNKLVTASLSPPFLQEWDFATDLKTQSWPGPTTFQGAAALSPDEQLCVVISLEGDVVARNLTDGNNVKLPLDVLEASGAAFSPDGKLFAVASNLGYARVWNVKTWKEVATLRGFRLATHSVVFSPDDKRLATGGGAGEQALKLWDTDSWQNVATLRGSGSLFIESLFSPDGNIIGALSGAGILHVWRAPSWAEIRAAEKAEAEAAHPPQTVAR